MSDTETLSKLVTVVADGYAAKYSGYPNDASYQHMLAQDTADLHYLAAEIKAGNLAGAYKFARNLDTAVREEIPNRVWKVLEANSPS